MQQPPGACWTCRISSLTLAPQSGNLKYNKIPRWGGGHLKFKMRSRCRSSALRMWSVVRRTWEKREGLEPPSTQFSPARGSEWSHTNRNTRFSPQTPEMSSGSTSYFGSVQSETVQPQPPHQRGYHRVLPSPAFGPEGQPCLPRRWQDAWLQGTPFQGKLFSCTACNVSTMPTTLIISPRVLHARHYSRCCICI